MNSVDYGSGDGHYECLATLLGFENALMSLVLEPEEADAFFARRTECKLSGLLKAKKYYNPDTFTLYDDVCTQKSPFMSPAVYRELIVPHYKRLFDAFKNEGIRPVLHCCGYATPLIEDIIDSGALCWTSVQPCNDIASLCKKYGDKICFSGVLNAFALSGHEEDNDALRAEVDRCFNEYGGLPGYVFSGGVFRPVADDEDIANAWSPTYVIGTYALEKAHSAAGLDFKSNINAFA